MDDAVSHSKGLVPSQELSEKAREYAKAFEVFCGSMSAAEREAFRQELLKRLSPKVAPQAGLLMGTVVNLFDRQHDWRVRDLKAAIAKEGLKVPPKPLYNVLGHLARHGKIKKLEYGRYVLLDQGALIETSDELGD